MYVYIYIYIYTYITDPCLSRRLTVTTICGTRPHPASSRRRGENPCEEPIRRRLAQTINRG